MAHVHALTEAYLRAILEVNERINLTRITDMEQARLLHIEDSLVALPEIEASPEGPYVDLGSGGGFPGVPLALASGRQTLLVDSVKKKMAAVSEVLETFGLDDQIKTYDGRIEELALERPQGFAVATARALSSLPALLELASPLLQRGGRLVGFKAHVSPEEEKQALHAGKQVGMVLRSRREVMLSDGETLRTILVYEKVAEPSLKLPRRLGLAQKKPLA